MKVMRWAFVVLAVLSLGVSTADAQVRGIGRIVGFVVDDGGAPIEGVKIRTATVGGDLIEVDSDAKGKWTLAGVGKGEWMVTVMKPGFTPKRLKVVIERELDRSQDIKVTMSKGA
jgi:hypothetical protein